MRRSHLGMTLIELIISLLISSLLLGCVLQVYFLCQRHINLQAEMQVIQLNANLVLQTLKNDIKLAGFLGCRNIKNISNQIGAERFNLNKENSLITTKDAITLWSAEKAATHLIAAPFKNELILSNEIKYKKGDVLVLSSCFAAEFFRVQEIKYQGAQQIVLSDLALHQLDEKSEIRRINRKYYTIKNHNLFVKLNDEAANEIAEGVNHIDSVIAEKNVTFQFEFITASMKSIWDLTIHLI